MVDYWRQGGATKMTYGDWTPLRTETLYSREIKFDDRVREYERNKKHEVQEASEVSSNQKTAGEVPSLPDHVETGPGS